MTQNINNISKKILFTPKQASLWASEYLGKKVTNNNILYLINYGKIANHSIDLTQNLIDKNELKAYYDKLYMQKNRTHPLSFAKYKEAETTKHIHRLHPYKGKFIPQLVEYFLDSHTDELKLESCFKKGDIILDLFCGSGTTLCVANELGMHTVGIDISCFNAMLSNAKLAKYDLLLLQNELTRLIDCLENHTQHTQTQAFEIALNEALSAFNQLYFPAKSFKRQLALRQIDEKSYAGTKEQEFLTLYQNLAKQYEINLSINTQGDFFDKWYLDAIKNELVLLKNEIKKAPKNLQDILMIIASRTARSCRATTHADLATLKEPITETYYCAKHGRICKPPFSILKWFKSYAKDTLKRLKEFDSLKSDSFAFCLNADSTNVDIIAQMQKHNSGFATLLQRQKIAGIFSSPPYVGLIDYHEQHAYAYDMFHLPHNDFLELGRLSDGQSKTAKEAYIQGVARSLINAKRFLKKDYNIFLVANDKFTLYPRIAEIAEMQIVATYHRPVLNRSEKDKNEYSESIFHLKER